MTSNTPKAPWWCFKSALRHTLPPHYCSVICTLQAVADAAASGNAQTAAQAIAEAASGANAAAQASATAEAINAAFTCGCAAGPATAQALSQAIASAGGCGNVSNALAGESDLQFSCIARHVVHHAVCIPACKVGPMVAGLLIGLLIPASYVSLAKQQRLARSQMPLSSCTCVVTA